MPGLHINDLKANVENFARGYLFNMFFTFAPGTLAGDSKASYLVRSTTLPESTIDPIEVPWQGQMMKIGSTHTFPEWECTFNVDKDAEIQKQFSLWSQLVHQPDTNLHGDPSVYYGEAHVELLNTLGNPITTYILHDLWPSTIGGIELSHDNKEVSQLSITFTYNYHTEL